MTPRDLGLAAIDEQLDARDIARVVRREKGHRPGGLVARTGAAPRRDTGSVCFERIDLLVVHAELGLVARSYDRSLCVHAYTNSRRESHCPDHLATNQVVGDSSPSTSLLPEWYVTSLFVPSSNSVLA
jgi:hypothetical protein